MLRVCATKYTWNLSASSRQTEFYVVLCLTTGQYSNDKHQSQFFRSCCFVDRCRALRLVFPSEKDWHRQSCCFERISSMLNPESGSVRTLLRPVDTCKRLTIVTSIPILMYSHFRDFCISRSREETGIFNKRDIIEAR